MLKFITKEILVPADEIDGIVTRLAKEIDRDYADKNLVIVCVLKGSVMFTIDLSKKLNSVCEMEFVRTFSYGNDIESSGKVQMKIDIAIDEIFSNIAYYAYGDDIGEATIRVELLGEPKAVAITFIDNGAPYDPLAKDDPDTTLSIEDREIGGLGIFMVKKSMDDISYEYRDGQNILTIKKNI